MDGMDGSIMLMAVLNLPLEDEGRPDHPRTNESPSQVASQPEMTDMVCCTDLAWAQCGGDEDDHEYQLRARQSALHRILRLPSL